eukprot:542467_1
MKSALVFILLYGLILFNVESKLNYRVRHRLNHHVINKAAHMGIDEKLRHQEEIDLFGFDMDQWFFNEEEEYPLKFGDNQLGVGNVLVGPLKMGKDLTRCMVYAQMVGAEETETDATKKKKKKDAYKAWNGKEPADGEKAGPFDVKTMWDAAKKTVDDLYKTSKFSSTKFYAIGYGGSHATGEDPKWTHAFGAGTMRAVRLYTDDYNNGPGGILRRLFYDYGTWHALMTDKVEESFKKFGIKLYLGTHSWSAYGGKKRVLKFLHNYVKEHGLIDKFVVEENFLYVYHGTKAGPMTGISDDWNLQGKSIWYGPTSTSLKYSLASAHNYGGKGIVFEIKIPMDTKQWPDGSHVGICAALMFSGKGEFEVLLWNIPTSWMTPVSTDGKWFIKQRPPVHTNRGAFGRAKTRDDAVNTISEMYAIQQKIIADRVVPK